MSSYLSFYKCPQCGGVVYNETYSTDGEDEFCYRCGRWVDIHLPKTDEEKAQLPEGEEFLQLKGNGLGRCMIMGTNGSGRSFSLLEPYSEAIEKWYMEMMAQADVDPEESYLTRWDEETKQVVVVHGKDPGLYDDEYDNQDAVQ